MFSTFFSEDLTRSLPQVPQPSLNTLDLTQIMRLVDGKIPGSIQVGMEDCPRIHKNSKHNKPSEGSEYSRGTVAGFLRKTDASIYAYQAKPVCGQIIGGKGLYTRINTLGHGGMRTHPQEQHA